MVGARTIFCPSAVCAICVFPKTEIPVPDKSVVVLVVVEDANVLEGLITTTCCEADGADMTIAPPLIATGTTPPAPGRCTKITRGFSGDALVVPT